MLSNSNKEEYKDKLKLKYLFYYLKSKEQELHNLSLGSARPFISQTNLFNFSISFPSIETQQQVIEKMEQKEQAIKSVELLLEQQKALFKKATDKFFN